MKTLITLTNKFLARLSPTYRAAMLEQKRERGYRLHLARKSMQAMYVKCAEHERYDMYMNEEHGHALWFDKTGPGYLTHHVWNYLVLK